MPGNFGDFDVRVEGIDSTIIGVRAQIAGVAARARALAIDTAEVAEKEMQHRAPRGATHRLASSIRMGPLVFRPGGAGGGGEHEIEVTVGGPEAPYTPFVLEGTGVHWQGFSHDRRIGNFRRALGGMGGEILAHPGNVFTFTKPSGELVHTRSVKGQRSQDLWISEAYAFAEAYVAAHFNALIGP